MLDEKLLEEGRLGCSGSRPIGDAENKALEEAIRIQKVRSLHQFMGSNLWQGDLAEMREDSPRPRRQGVR